MATILAIETALDTCSVAVGKEGRVLASKEETGFNLHSSRLTILIEEVLADAGLKINSLQAVCVSKGPGSYTGLRIGVSVAKGLCYALDLPLIGLNTLESMARRVIGMRAYESIMYCPMIDARRMEVYYALLDNKEFFLHPTSPAIVTPAFLADELSGQKIVFFGNGMPKCRELIESKNALFVENIYSRADELIAPAEEAFAKAEFENLFNFEPFYLKEFMAGTPKKII